MTLRMLGRKPVLALLTRLLWAAALALFAFGAKAGAVFTTLYSFTGTNDGANPQAALVQGSDGEFYGTTAPVATNDGYGTVFKITTEGVLTTLYSFTGGDDGADPLASLVLGRDGNFYGTTYGGGMYSNGTVFKITTNGMMTSLYSFAGPNDGAHPMAGLVQGSDGYFYGTTYNGGTNGNGTVFKIGSNGALTTLHLFDYLDGAYPQAALVQGKDGNFYGTTDNGGTNGGFGTVFDISTNGSLTTLFSFGGYENGVNGVFPQAALVLGRDGNFYGTCENGGPYPAYTVEFFGTVFIFSNEEGVGALGAIYYFGDGNDGGAPNGLVQGSDGFLYGTTQVAGGDGNGTVFQISTNGALTSLYSFTGGSDGEFPQAALVQGRDGSFYGTTSGFFVYRGTYGFGTVFRLTIVPEFQSVTLTNSTLNLTWSTEAGGMYQLQYTSDLSSSNWSNLGSAVTATGATLSTTDSLTNGPQRFYRLALLP